MVELMDKRTLKIDVIGPVEGTDIVKCKLRVNGRTCAFWTTQSNYEALMYDNIFIRDGKEIDSDGVINTTKVFVEED